MINTFCKAFTVIVLLFIFGLSCFAFGKGLIGVGQDFIFTTFFAAVFAALITAIIEA